MADEVSTVVITESAGVTTVTETIVAEVVATETTPLIESAPKPAGFDFATFFSCFSWCQPTPAEVIAEVTEEVTAVVETTETAVVTTPAPEASKPWWETLFPWTKPAEVSRELAPEVEEITTVVEETTVVVVPSVAEAVEAPLEPIVEETTPASKPEDTESPVDAPANGPASASDKKLRRLSTTFKESFGKIKIIGRPRSTKSSISETEEPTKAK